jgi:NTP pyrophosphatase (non-canonical NTP hydrolase)
VSGAREAGRGARELTLDEYQGAARRTMNAELAVTDRLVDGAAGLAEEAGEVLGLVRKHAFMGHPLDRERVARELGDALWCIAAVASCLGVSLGDVAAQNVAKLEQRYPGGYSDEASRTRSD